MIKKQSIIESNYYEVLGYFGVDGTEGAVFEGALPT
jgi:hypothetical protein